jgi:predicted metal-dependent hydrolase
LAFNWRLVMAPAFVQDYVAAHEVAHLRHMNHGPQFWELVSALTEHAEAARAWLRAEGERLMRVGAG